MDIYLYVFDKNKQIQIDQIEQIDEINRLNRLDINRQIRQIRKEIINKCNKQNNYIQLNLPPKKMLIKFTICSELVLPADQYTQNCSKSIRNQIFQQYLFKIVNLGNQSNGICIKIQSIQVLGNVIIRKTADLKVKVKVCLVILRLVSEQYYEGLVQGCDQDGIYVGFVAGLLTGTLTLQNMHADTIYNHQRNMWILTERGGKGYQWKIGSKVGFKIHQTLFSEQPIESDSKIQMKDLIKLKANEPGLGPMQWWV